MSGARPDAAKGAHPNVGGGAPTQRAELPVEGRVETLHVGVPVGGVLRCSIKKGPGACSSCRDEVLGERHSPEANPGCTAVSTVIRVHPRRDAG